jgi:hypothetical protein
MHSAELDRLAPSRPDSLAWLATGQRTALLAVIGGALVLGIVPLLGAFFLFPKNYNEGWNTYHALRAAAGEVLYSGDPRHPVNYPFLSFFIVGWLKPLVGDAWVFGRLLNLLALAAVTAGGYVVVRRLGGGRSDALFAAACTFGYQVIQAPDWIGADDPHMLGEACMIAGLLCYLHDRTGIRGLAAAALFLGIGGFIKHNLIAIPLAISLDILCSDRRRFLIWLGLAGAIVAVLTGLTYLIAGGDFLTELLAPRVLSVVQMKYHPRKFAITFKLPLLLAVVFLMRRLPSAQAVLLRSYGIVAIVSAIVFAAAEGTSFNLFLDSTVWLAIVCGLALQRWRAFLATKGRAARAATVLLPLLLAQPIVTRLPDAIARLADLPATLQRFALLEARFANATRMLAERAGPALCESLLLCAEAGKPLLIDPYNARQMILTGRLDEASLLADIAQHRFTTIELPALIFVDEAKTIIDPFLSSPPRFTERMLRAIDAYYEPTIDPGDVIFYTPR